MILPKINIKYLFILLLSSILLGFVYNSLSPNGIPLLYKEKVYESLNDISKNTSNENNNNTPVLINLEQAISLFEKNTTFIDARDQWDFADGHIINAVNIPEYKFNPEDNILKSMNKLSVYVIYCGGDDCDISKRLADELKKIGFKNLYIYTGGFDEWEKNKLPVEK